MGSVKMNALSQMVDRSNSSFDNVPSITEYSDGVVEFPVMALQEYCEKHDVKQNEGVSYGLQLEGGAEGVYDYFITKFDEKNVSMIHRIYYIDNGGAPDGSDVRAEIPANDLLKLAIYRRLFSGNCGICGLMSIDQGGRLWMDVLAENNIEAIIIMCLQPVTPGLTLTQYDLLSSKKLAECRISFDGEKLLYEPIAIDLGTLPS